jgi:hypothetical protein
LEIRSKTLAYEFSTVVQEALDDGRDHLSDDEANHLLRISERLVREYVKELENSLENQI